MKKRLAILLLMTCSVHAAALQDPTRPYLTGHFTADIHPAMPHTLSAVFTDDASRIAMIDGRLVKEGQLVGDDRVVFIGTGIVQLEGPGGRISLFLPGGSVKTQVEPALKDR